MTNNIPENNYLVHYGIKGMKWGKRRFQNKDGSLTPAGQRRYNEGGDDNDYKPNPNANKFGKGTSSYNTGSYAVLPTSTRTDLGGFYKAYSYGNHNSPAHGGTNGNIGGSYEKANREAKARADQLNKERREYREANGANSEERRYFGIGSDRNKSRNVNSGGKGSQQTEREAYESHSVASKANPRPRTPNNGGPQFASYVSRRRSSDAYTSFGDYKPITGESLYGGGGSSSKSNKKESGDRKSHVINAGRASNYASSSQRMSYYGEKNNPYVSDEYKRELEYNSKNNNYGGDTASTYQRKEKSNNKKKSAFDMTDKEWEQVQNNHHRAYNQQQKEWHPGYEANYNPSKQIFTYSKGITSSGRPYGEKTERSGQGEYHNNARNNNNADAWEKARKEALASKSSSKSSIQSKVNQTISEVSKTASKTVEKATNWLNKLLGKKGK